MFGFRKKKKQGARYYREIIDHNLDAIPRNQKTETYYYVEGNTGNAVLLSIIYLFDDDLKLANDGWIFQSNIPDSAEEITLEEYTEWYFNVYVPVWSSNKTRYYYKREDMSEGDSIANIELVVHLPRDGVFKYYLIEYKEMVTYVHNPRFMKHIDVSDYIELGEHEFDERFGNYPDAMGTIGHILGSAFNGDILEDILED